MNESRLTGLLPDGGGGAPTDAMTIEGLRMSLRRFDQHLEEATKRVDALLEQRIVIQRAIDILILNGDGVSQSGDTPVSEQSHDYMNKSIEQMICIWASKNGGVADLHAMSHELAGYKLWRDPRAAGKALHRRAIRMAEEGDLKKVAPSRYRMLRSSNTDNGNTPDN